ncbi:hypothetical protein C1H46_005930 [Malus baccata]|uniref:Uncharacterized protein n=1 Tax=Malus baccata TaxID=106549 RepID=A0A540NBN8_MALBA|nr:hypothetical protein C1H46_005930 [Malus baccata]
MHLSSLNLHAPFSLPAPFIPSSPWTKRCKSLQHHGLKQSPANPNPNLIPLCKNFPKPTQNPSSFCRQIQIQISLSGDVVYPASLQFSEIFGRRRNWVFLGDKGFVVFAASMTFLTISALNLYKWYVMAMVCAVPNHHKSVRLVVLGIWWLW